MRHAIDRAWERYEVRLRIPDLRYIQRAIDRGDPVTFPMFTRPDNSQEVAVFVKGQWLCFLTGADNGLITCLPKRHLDGWWGRLNARWEVIQRTLRSTMTG